MLGVVQLQGPGHRVQHLVRGAGQLTAFQPGVVVDADPGQQGDLLPAQPGDPAVPAVGRQAGLLRGQPGPAAGQEVPDVVLQFHDHDARARASGEPGPVSTRNSRSSHTPVKTG